MRFFSELSLLATSRSARSVFLTALAVLSWGTGMVENVVMGDLAVTVEMTDTADAALATLTANATPAKTQESTEDGVMKMMNVVVESVMMLFLPATIIAGWLLSPDWTFGEIFGLRPILHQLWVLISNVVYVIFAFLLVGIAFMNIFWAGGDQYAIKKALPRFVVGILIVPFTWFAVSAILSISNILTASVLRLPADILQNVKGANDKEFTFKMPEACTLNFDKVSEGAGTAKSATPAKPASTAKSDTPPAGKIFECGDATIDMTFRDILASDKGAYGILNVYAYGIFKVQDFKKIDSFSLKSVSGVLDMIISTGIWILFLFIFALLVLALTFALFTRAMYMWLIAVFSPLFGLFYFMEGKGKFAEEYGKKIGFASFVSLAMVPVYAAAALGFGLLFLKMVESAPIVAENSSFFSEAVGDKNSTTFRMGGEKKSVKIEVKGLPTGISEKAGKAGNIAGKGVALAGSAIGKIIVDVLGLVVLWLAVMAALNSSEITKQAVSPISEFGASMGKLIKSLPQHTPIPLPGGHKMSMKGLEQLGAGIVSGVQTKGMGEWNAVGQRIGSGWSGDKHIQNGKNVIAKISSNSSASDISKAQRELLSGMGPTSAQGFATNAPEKRLWAELIDKTPKNHYIDAKPETLAALKKNFETATYSSSIANAVEEFNKNLKEQAAKLPEAQDWHLNSDDLNAAIKNAQSGRAASTGGGAANSSINIVINPDKTVSISGHQVPTVNSDGKTISNGQFKTVSETIYGKTVTSDQKTKLEADLGSKWITVANS